MAQDDDPRKKDRVPAKNDNFQAQVKKVYNGSAPPRNNNIIPY